MRKRECQFHKRLFIGRQNCVSQLCAKNSSKYPERKFTILLQRGPRKSIHKKINPLYFSANATFDTGKQIICFILQYNAKLSHPSKILIIPAVLSLLISPAINIIAWRRRCRSKGENRRNFDCLLRHSILQVDRATNYREESRSSACRPLPREAGFMGRK